MKVKEVAEPGKKFRVSTPLVWNTKTICLIQALLT